MGIKEQGVKPKKNSKIEENPHQPLTSWQQLVQPCCPSSVQLNYWNPANLYFSPQSYKFKIIKRSSFQHKFDQDYSVNRVKFIASKNTLTYIKANFIWINKKWLISVKQITKKSWIFQDVESWTNIKETLVQYEVFIRSDSKAYIEKWSLTYIWRSLSTYLEGGLVWFNIILQIH